ncbi:MAG: ABC transporter permease [Spirochaetales bacterium]
MSISRAFVVFRKEVRDLFRDIKTIIVSIVVPLVLFPLSFGLMETVGVAPENASIDLSVVNLPSSLEQFLKTQPALRLHPGSHSAARRMMEQGRIDALLVGEENAFTISFDSRRSESVGAAEAVADLYARFLEVQQQAIVPPEGELAELIAREIVLDDRGPGSGVALLALLLPLLLLVASAVSAMPSAADVAAGEKERSTIAPLLATSAAPIDLILGKLLAIATLAAIGTAAFLGGIVLSQLVAPDLFGESVPALAPTSNVVKLAACAILLTLFFSSLELLVSLFADSPKEAQAYLLPILIVSLGCGYVAATVDALAPPAYAFHIPLVNVATTLKLLVLGIDPGVNLIWTALWMMIYIAVTTTGGLLRIKSERMIL